MCPVEEHVVERCLLDGQTHERVQQTCHYFGWTTSLDDIEKHAKQIKGGV